MDLPNVNGELCRLPYHMVGNNYDVLCIEKLQFQIVVSYHGNLRQNAAARR